MILDIRFVDSSPVQYQHVRRTTLYVPTNDLPVDYVAEPELVIHFEDSIYPQMNIPLRRIVICSTTND